MSRWQFDPFSSLTSMPSARPEVIAHRGASAEEPENSLAAFRAAVELGADGIELDVHLTSDDVPIVIHDPVLPPADGTPAARIRFLSLREIQRRAPTVPALDEAIEAIGQRCRLYVEIKDPHALDGVLRRISHLGDMVAVHSFDHRVIAAAADAAPGIARGILLVSYLVDPTGAMRAARARDVWQQVDRLDGELVDRVHANGGRVIAWTVNDDARARALLDLGVDGLCTDRTREIRALVDRHETLARPSRLP